MRSTRLLSALLGLAVTAMASNAAFLSPLAQASSTQDTPSELRLGDRQSIRESDLGESELRAAIKDALAKQAASVGATSAVEGQSIVDAPNITPVHVQNTSTWAGLTDYASDLSGRMIIAYLDSRDGAHANGGDSLYVRRSHDGGQTWQAEQRIDNPSGPGTAGFAMNISTDGNGNFYLIWDDTRTTANSQLYSSHSRDGGVTWSTPVLIAPAGDVAFNADIVSGGRIGHVFVVWEDNRVGPLESRIYGMSSFDFGATWSDEVLIDDAGAGFNEGIPVATLVRPNEIMVGWESDRTGGVGDDFMIALSTDGGVNWSADGRLNPDPAGATSLHGADLCSDGNGQVYAMIGQGDGTIWTRTSNNFGRNFAAPIEITGPDFSKLAQPATSLACAFGSTYAVVAFEGGTTAGIGDDDILTVVSKDAGATWSTPQRVNTGVVPETFDAGEVQADVDSQGRMLVAWTDLRTGGFDGFLNYSVDAGTTWQSSDMRFTGGIPSATRTVVLAPQVAGGPTDPAYYGVQTKDRNIFDLVWHDTLAGAPGVYYASAAFEGSKTSMERLAGSNRYNTSVAISGDAFPTAGTASAAVFATGEVFADGLASTPLAGQIGGPVLLVRKNSLPSEVAAEYLRIYDKNPDADVDAYIAGGTAAVAESVAAAIRALDPTITLKRLGGANRNATSVEIAKEIDSLRKAGPKKILLATGANFPDALAAGAVGANTGIEPSTMPVLLTGSTTLDPVVSAYLASVSASVTDVHIFGGTSAVSSAVQAAVDAIGGSTVTRHAGSDRYATAAQVATDFYTGVMAPLAFGLATGENFADALGGGR